MERDKGELNIEMSEGVSDKLISQLTSGIDGSGVINDENVCEDMVVLQMKLSTGDAEVDQYIMQDDLKDILEEHFEDRFTIESDKDTLIEFYNVFVDSRVSLIAYMILHDLKNFKITEGKFIEHFKSALTQYENKLIPYSVFKILYSDIMISEVMNKGLMTPYSELNIPNTEIDFTTPEKYGIEFNEDLFYTLVDSIHLMHDQKVILISNKLDDLLEGDILNLKAEEN